MDTWEVKTGGPMYILGSRVGKGPLLLPSKINAWGPVGLKVIKGISSKRGQVLIEGGTEDDALQTEMEPNDLSWILCELVTMDLFVQVHED